MRLHTSIALGLGLGALLGSLANAFFGVAAFVPWLANNVAYPVGQVFLRMLFMTVVPVVLMSLALGVAGIGDMRTLGRLGGRTLGSFLVSTLVAAGIGLVLVTALHPGVGLSPRCVTRSCSASAGRAWSGRAPGTSACPPSWRSCRATPSRRPRRWTCWR